MSPHSITAIDEAITAQDSDDAGREDRSSSTQAAPDDCPAVAREDIDGARVAGALRWCRRHWAALLVAVALVAALGAAGDVYWRMDRPDQQTAPAVSKQVLDAATEGTVSTLSYGFDTFDTDLTRAKTHLTGEFLTYYSAFANQFVGPAVKQKQVKTSASVVKAAVSELHPDRAVVLLFVNQVTTSNDRPDSALATSTILVTLTKVQDSWLISEFNPV